MLFWKICWNLVGIRGWVISTGRTWATSSTQGQCVSVFVDWLRLGGRPVSNISELSWILFLNVGRYILCHEVSEIKGCVQASNLPTFKISGMCYIILFKHGTKFSSFTHLMSVLFDAPQIPAGMHPFRWIPPDSTGIHWIPVEWNQNPVEWAWIPLDCDRWDLYKCLYIQMCIYK